MALVNFEDKVMLSENPSVPDINKCKDTDLNLIKKVVNQIIKTLGLYIDNWDSSGTYTVGDIVINDNRYFKNITGLNTTTEPKNDIVNWEEVTIILNEKSSSLINTYNCNYINSLLNGVYPYSFNGKASINITSANGYGVIVLFSTLYGALVQFQGSGNTPNVVTIYGTPDFTTSASGNVVTLSSFNSWDHYIMFGSSAISKIE